MATDDVVANPGSGGSTFRTLADAGGIEWPASVVCYAPTISAGNNVLQPVNAANPLPIVLTAGSAVVGHVITDSGSVMAATQSGTWNITNVSGTISLPTGAATAAKQPALGTAGSASADVITVQGITSMTPLKVDGSGVTQPVSGTFWQATQPVSAASLPLPSGASTAAKQPALGVAGTASSDVITVQGIASMTALKVDGSAVTQPVSGTVSAQPNATTSGGCSMSTFLSAVSNNLTAVKASAGNIYSIVVVNTTATIYYLKIFDGTPTMGSTSANWNIPIPANTSAAGVVIPLPVPISCATNISVALTGGLALADNTNAATGVAVNIAYK